MIRDAILKRPASAVSGHWREECSAADSHRASLSYRIAALSSGRRSMGRDRYRRGLYILFQRTVPYPMLVNFDEPDASLPSCRKRPIEYSAFRR